MYNCTTLPVLFKQKLIKHAKKQKKKKFNSGVTSFFSYRSRRAYIIHDKLQVAQTLGIVNKKKAKVD